ncbi:PH domain-containing protein [Brachybacterium huguangmaarense]|uniref:PH domain-containing protein n=1 Tax=Brachybacterium huguangmaarense TaxID=1652028 RepID=A0ABY6FYW2_9MICO|nr:PH domain-containing protein [Brachybacterium huguangmaarense]UYG16052.1 PH domain-containing protein [Brachybacterium huguangmaarense]
MDATSVGAAPPEVVLYRARTAPWLRLAGAALILVLVVLAAAWNASLLARGDGPTSWSVLGSLLVIGLPAVLVVLGLRPAFSVTTRGITVTGQLGGRRIPWSDVQLVRISGRPQDRGGAEVVLHDGTVVRSPITAARFALRRGESPDDHGPDIRSPARPVRAAVDAHRRYLRGEFGAPAPRPLPAAPFEDRSRR